MTEIFEAHMEEPAAQLELVRAGEIAAARPSALLCYEAQAPGCHRAIVADRLRERLGFEIEDL
jgi:uncharacterized protein (DUF488 family)